MIGLAVAPPRLVPPGGRPRLAFISSLSEVSMIRRIALSAVAAMIGCAFVVPTVCASPQDELSAAAKKVADAPNYSWKSEIENAGGGGGRGGQAGPTEGQMEKDGLVHLTMTRGDNTIESYANGKKGAVKMGDDWKSFAELTSDDAGGGGGGRRNPGRMIVRMMENFKGPATEAVEMAGEVKDLKEADGALEGTLGEEAAKKLIVMGGGPRRGGANAGGGNGPQITNTKAKAKFWVKDGQLAKMQYNVTGTMSFNGNDREINRTTTVEFKDVGSTKITVPEDAKKKME
jgi:hypothetical protein